MARVVRLEHGGESGHLVLALSRSITIELALTHRGAIGRCCNGDLHDLSR